MSIASKIRGWAAKARALAGTHAGQQVGRFVRVAVLAAGTAWIDGGHLLSWPALSAAAAGGAEVAYRQWRQTVTAGEVVVPEPDPVQPDPASPPALAPVPSTPVAQDAPASVPVSTDPAVPDPGLDGSSDTSPVDPSQGL